VLVPAQRARHRDSRRTNLIRAAGRNHPERCRQMWGGRPYRCRRRPLRALASYSRRWPHPRHSVHGRCACRIRAVVSAASGRTRAPARPAPACRGPAAGTGAPVGSAARRADAGGPFPPPVRPGQWHGHRAGLGPAQLPRRRGQQRHTGTGAHQRDRGLHELDLWRTGSNPKSRHAPARCAARAPDPRASGHEELGVGQCSEIDPGRRTGPPRPAVAPQPTVPGGPPRRPGRVRPRRQRPRGAGRAGPARRGARGRARRAAVGPARPAPARPR